MGGGSGSGNWNPSLQDSPTTWDLCLGLRPHAPYPVAAEVKQPKDRAEWQAMEPEEPGEAHVRVVVIGLDIFRSQIFLRTGPAPAAFTLVPCHPQPSPDYRLFTGLLPPLPPTIAIHTAPEGSLNPER